MSRHATSTCVVVAVVLATVTTGISSRAEQGEQGIVVLNDNDLRRGYVVHWGAPRPPFEPVRPVKVAIGTKEKESFELGVFALRDVGAVSLSVRSKPELPEQSLRLRTMQGISTSMGVQKFGWGILTVGRKGVDAPMEWKDYALLDGHDLQMPAGAHKSFWLTLDGKQIAPGRYILNLGIAPKHADRREVQLTIEVIDVRLEREDDLHLMMYHNDSCLQQHRPEVFRKHLQLMRETGQRQFRIDPGFGQHRRSVKFRRNERDEIEADYAGIDRLLKTARKMGFDVFGWPTNGGVSDDWLSAEMKSLPDEKRQALKEELTRRFFQHILDLGFREIWWYCIDEPPIEQATDPKFIELLSSFKKKFPMLRPHCALNKYRPHLVKALNPWMDSVDDVLRNNPNSCQSHAGNPIRRFSRQRQRRFEQVIQPIRGRNRLVVRNVDSQYGPAECLAQHPVHLAASLGDQVDITVVVIEGKYIREGVTIRTWSHFAVVVEHEQSVGPVVEIGEEIVDAVGAWVMMHAAMPAAKLFRPVEFPQFVLQRLRVLVGNADRFRRQAVPAIPVSTGGE